MGGLRHGSGSKKGGSLLRHIHVLDIYMSCSPNNSGASSLIMGQLHLGRDCSGATSQ